jgi:methionyl-tRNA formyltransferase
MEGKVRVLYFGMVGDFSLIPLRHLLAAGVEVVGIVVAGQADGDVIRPLLPPPSTPGLPVLNPYFDRNIIQVGWQQRIPVWAVGRLEDEGTLATLAAVKPDVTVVACFSRRIPKGLLAVPRYGFLNLHPSLLPRYRGPQPLFWCFRQEEAETGVTVHFMDEGLDTGDIVLQARVDFGDGISGDEADKVCAERGGELLVEAVERLAAGQLARVPQTADFTYYLSPTEADFHIPTSWSARRAFNFMRGTADWGRPFTIEGGDEKVVVATAVAYDPQQQLDKSLVHEAGVMAVQFNPGVLYVR